MQFVDRELARRFESAEAVPQTLFAREAQRLNPSLNVACEEIAGGLCVFIHPGCVVGRCVSLGLSQPVTEADLDRVEEFYRSRGEAAQIDVTPVSDISLHELMKQRPYRLEELNNVLVRPLSRDERFDLSGSNANIRMFRRDEAQAVCEVVARGFAEGADPDPKIIEVLKPSYESERSVVFVAEVDRKLVAAGGILLIPETNIATMFGSATLPDFRGRGIQSAFLRHRLKYAAEAGAEYAVIVTRGGTTSQRNAERQGFVTAYSKAVMKRDFNL